jgi:aspartate-semialdehyde dehydrogenase
MKVAFVGWRGMVGSVLMERMQAEQDFAAGFEASFFSTSQAGQPAPAVGIEAPPVADAHDLKLLAQQDVIVTCQGGSYTSSVLPALRQQDWQGYWIDAASTLRMDDEAVIILDPVNRKAIDRALAAGTKNFIGGNCTVSLMLMGLIGLFRQGWVEWVSSMTYQAASGAGAQAMRELVTQMQALGQATSEMLADPATSILALDRRVTEVLRHQDFPKAAFGTPLAASLIPWIDRPMEGGQTREEWKGGAETNKILEANPAIPVDGICVRVGAMRCHSQALTIKLSRDVPLDEIEGAIAESHQWAEVVANTKEATLDRLSPAAISGTLDVPVGRLHKLQMGPQYLGAMTVGDQLLWGAAEPLRRMLRILFEHLR